MNIFGAISYYLFGGASTCTRWLSYNVVHTFPLTRAHELHETDRFGSTDWFDDTNSINPATGLLMVGGDFGVDVAGNPYGTDMSNHDVFNSHDTFHSGSSGLHDSFGCGSSGLHDSFDSGCSMHDW